MNIPHKLKLLSFIGLLLTACLFQTQPQEANRGSVVDNEIANGNLFLADGKPAISARVRVFPINQIPDSTTKGFSTFTDSLGRYNLDSLPEGKYNILGEKDGAYSYLDSIEVSNKNSIPSDTLKAPGSVVGIVGLQPNHDPRTVTVQILGTYKFSNVDAIGKFHFENLAGGIYSLRVITTLPDYTPLYTSLEVKSAKRDSLADTLKIPYTGIPVVQGLRATYDTLLAVVRLSWDPVVFRDFSQYAVFRDFARTTKLSDQPVDFSDGAAYADTLVGTAGKSIFQLTDTNVVDLEYRVRVQNKSDSLGVAYGKLRVRAAGPGMVRTKFAIGLREVTWDPVQAADTLSLLANLDNPTRGLREIAWMVESLDAAPIKHILSGKKQESDSVRLGWKQEGPVTIYVKVTDDAGKLWVDSLTWKGNRAPTMVGTPSAKVKANEEIFLFPSGSDPDGDTLRYSISNKPAWAIFDSLTGTLSGIPSNADTGIAKDIDIRVTDGRRIIAGKPFNLTVEKNPWKLLRSFPKNTAILASTNLNGKLYVFAKGEHMQVLIYDSVSDTWPVVGNIPLPPSPVNATFYPYPYKDKILTFYLKDDYSVKDANLFDPATGAWTQFNQPHDMDSLNLDFGITVGGWKNTIYAFGSSSFRTAEIQASVHAYDPETNTWSNRKQAPFPIIGGGSAATYGNDIYLLNWNIPKTIQVYHPPSNTWSTLPLPSDLVRGNTGCGASEKLFLASDISEKTDSTYLYQFDIPSAKWSLKSARPNNNYARCVEYAGKIFFDDGYLYDPAVDN